MSIAKDKVWLGRLDVIAKAVPVESTVPDALKECIRALLRAVWVLIYKPGPIQLDIIQRQWRCWTHPLHIETKWSHAHPFVLHPSFDKRSLPACDDRGCPQREQMSAL